MSNIKDKTGIAPKIRDEIYLRDLAMVGDMVLTISPTTLASDATTAAWTRTVSLALKTAAGDVHTWFNGSVVCAIADNTTKAIAALASGDTAPVFEAGLASVTITGTGNWENAKTDTLTVSNKTIMGYTVTGGTSVETFST